MKSFVYEPLLSLSVHFQPDSIVEIFEDIFQYLTLLILHSFLFDSIQLTHCNDKARKTIFFKKKKRK